MFVHFSKHGNLFHEWVVHSLLLDQYLRIYGTIVDYFMLADVDHGPLKHFLEGRMIFVGVNDVLGSCNFDGLNEIVLIVVDVDVPEEAEVVGGAQPLEVDPEDHDGESDEPEGHEEDVGCHTHEDCQQLQDVVGCDGLMAEEEATEQGGQLKIKLESVHVLARNERHVRCG